MTEWAVLASRPVVGSSRNRMPGDGMSSRPMLHRLRSPPDTPRVNWSPILVSEQFPVSVMYTRPNRTEMKMHVTVRYNACKRRCVVMIA